MVDCYRQSEPSLPRRIRIVLAIRLPAGALPSGTAYAMEPNKVDKKKAIGDAEQQALTMTRKNTSEGGEKVLGAANVPNAGPHQWRNLTLRFSGAMIIGLVDGKVVVSANDALYTRGMAGLLAGGTKARLSTPFFDDMIVKAVDAPTPAPSSPVLGQAPMYRVVKPRMNTTDKNVDHLRDSMSPASRVPTFP